MPADLVPFPSPSSTLEAIASTIDAAHERRGWNSPPVAYGLRTSRHGVDLVARELSGHPADVLVGFTAPTGWTAFAVGCEGSAYAVPEANGLPHGRLRRTEPVDRVRAVHLVHRDGTGLTVLRRQSTGERLKLASAPGQALPGRIDDTCRRVLGVPTPPPDSSPHHLWAVVWLDAVVAAAADATRPLDARSVGLLHPAFQLWSLGGHPMPPWSPEVLGRFGRALGNVTDWELLRKRCAAGRWPLGAVTADAAAWMDAGMFCREVLGSFLALERYLEILTELLPARVFDGIRAALRCWDLPDRAA